ncbi:MAG: hypothetical protein RLZZ221_1772 [Verrucomicrobiota bacterium]|jgi:hypothetical protein
MPVPSRDQIPRRFSAARFIRADGEFAQTFVREGGLKYNAQKQGTLYATGVKLTY